MCRAAPLLPLIAALIGLCGCEPPVEGFDTQLRFVTPGDQDVFAALDRLEITFFYTGEEPIGFVLDAPFPAEQPLNDLPRAEAGEVRVEVLGKAQDAAAQDGFRLAAQGSADGFALPTDDPITVFLALKGRIAQLSGGLSNPRGDAVGVALPDGRVLVVGGVDLEAPIGPVEILLGGEDPWMGAVAGEIAGNLPLVGHQAMLIENSGTAFDGKVVILGGDRWCGDVVCSDASNASNLDPNFDLLVFDPADDEIEAIGTLDDGTIGGKGVSLPDGRVVVFGGFNDQLAYIADPTIFDPDAGTAGLVVLNADTREQHTVTIIEPAGGRLLLAGGIMNNNLKTTAEVWDPSGSLEVVGELAQPRMRHTATLLPDGKVIVVGGATGAGFSSAGTPLDSAEFFNPSTGMWTPSGAALNYPRQRHLAIPLDDGEGSILICGGVTEMWQTPVSACERYSAVLDAFTVLDGPGLAPGGGGMGHAVLADGRIVLFGGIAEGEPRGEVYLYTP